MKYDYEEDDVTFNAPAYSIDDNGIAFYVMGWQIEKYYDEIEVLDENGAVTDVYTDFDECISKRTGLVVVRAVGDDMHRLYEQKDLKPLSGLAFCRDCGQIGCKANSYE